jgi:hypothetical protein
MPGRSRVAITGVALDESRIDRAQVAVRNPWAADHPSSIPADLPVADCSVPVLSGDRKRSGQSSARAARPKAREYRTRQVRSMNG